MLFFINLDKFYNLDYKTGLGTALFTPDIFAHNIAKLRKKDILTSVNRFLLNNQGNLLTKHIKLGVNHHYFMIRFWANFPSKKFTNPNFMQVKAAQNTFVQKNCS